MGIKDFIYYAALLLALFGFIGWAIAAVRESNRRKAAIQEEVRREILGEFGVSDSGTSVNSVGIGSNSDTIVGDGVHKSMGE